ncbi:MAG: hypothetical protein J6R18_09670 [Kiritimatiellae bacterium]|nr:hypothetical protein [Kiritimatiellia bacterium]
MDSVKVEICCGTACYLLGASSLMNVDELLPEEYRKHVEIEARTCLELCEKDNLGGAPYVRFNDSEIMSRATPESVKARILELLEGSSLNG